MFLNDKFFEELSKCPSVVAKKIGFNLIILETRTISRKILLEKTCREKP